MNFLGLILTVLAAKLAFASDIFDKKEEEEALIINENLTNSIINTFPAELWVEIGSFLALPQQELGYLNKAISNAVFKLYPYRKIVARRYGIHELNDLENDEDMAWFKSLLQIKDPVEVFRSISSGFLNQRAFPNSKGPICRYMIRVLFSLPAEVAQETIALNTDSIVFYNFIYTLFELEYYAQIIEIYKFYPSIITYSLDFVDIEKLIKLINQIFNVSEEDEPELFKESVDFFNFIFQNRSEFQKPKFLYCCMMAKVQLKYYINYLFQNLDNFNQILQVPYYREHPKLSVEESERIYELLLVILDEYRIKLLENGNLEQDQIEELYERAKILFKIGFKPEIEEDLYELEIKNGNFDYQSMRYFANYALFSGRL